MNGAVVLPRRRTRPASVHVGTRSERVDVVRVTDRLGQRSDDGQILQLGNQEGLVVLTNDRDFVELASTVDHGGIVLYTDRTLLIGDPVGSTEAISAIDRFYSPVEMQNIVEWLDNWR